MAAQVAAAAAAGFAASMYLDAKYLIRNDLRGGSLAAKAAEAQAFLMDRMKNDKMLVYHMLEDHAKGARADDLFLMFEGRTYTYKQFYDQTQRVGNWLVDDLGIRKGELVALDGANSPEYLLIWFALDAIGACPAFINCNLTSQPLVHSVKLSDARWLVADSDRRPLVEPYEKELESSNINTVYYDQDFILNLPNSTPIPHSLSSGVAPDTLRSLIYTSGTTGLPKGTIMVSGRSLITARNVAKYLNLQKGDRMYTALPLYHGAGHGLCVTPSVCAGTTVVLSRRFSHKTFWPEVRASNANILQYVGELCRYLINAPPSALDKQHNVRMAWGNGMRPDVWEAFRQRFGVEIINELYAATDGMGACFNANRGPFSANAVAVRGLYWHYANGANEKRVLIHPDTQEILRSPTTGFATVCPTNTPGEVIHRLDPAANYKMSFAGYYNNPAASEKRFIRDVFAKGDLWFRSGDMMRCDADGRVYFVDRLGDTFRWKSENVSTNEVSDVLGQFEQIAEANVYGVMVPKADGRCGMAAIVPVQGVTEDGFRWDEFASHVIGMLPRYAVPVFVRVVKELDYTGTMKVQKGKLRGQGIDLDAIAKEHPDDRIFWLRPGGDRYVKFDRQSWEQLEGGGVRL